MIFSPRNHLPALQFSARSAIRFLYHFIFSPFGRHFVAPAAFFKITRFLILYVTMN